MIYFYNTYLGIGGAENLIFSIIKHASSNEIKIGLIGINKGYLYERLIDEKLSFSFIDHTKINYFKNFKQSDILVLFGNFYGINSLKYFPGKIIVWAILYSSITKWNRFHFEKKIFNKNIFSHFFNKRLIQLLLKRNSLYAMDGNVCEELKKYLGKTVNIPLIPIPTINISTDNEYIKLHEKRKKYINVTYIGRGDDIWKIKPLKKIATDISQLNLKINIHVFTDNDNLFKKEITIDNVNIYYHFGYFGVSLEEKILDLSDIHFSMGTAALEAAKLGVPTILIDASYNDFPIDYKYKWLFNTKEFSLGSFINSDYKKEGISIEQVFEIFSDFKYLSEISQNSLDYTKNNHELVSIFEIINNIKSKTTIKDILKYTPASWNLIK